MYILESWPFSVSCCKMYNTEAHVQSTHEKTSKHTNTLTVWWWIILTSCTNVEQPVWAHWSISEHSCYTAQRQHNNDSVFRDTQSHAAHGHTHLHTLASATVDSDIICRVSKDSMLWGLNRSNVWLQYNSIYRHKSPQEKDFKSSLCQRSSSSSNHIRLSITCIPTYSSSSHVVRSEFNNFTVRSRIKTLSCLL